MVNYQLIQPQEIEVFYILPTIRRYLTVFMKEYGLSQKKIAELLHIKESTVSQYISSKRASKINFEENIQKEIRLSANKINNKADLIRETQKILGIIRNNNILCKVHRKLAGLPEDCKINIMKCCE